jgi:uncharacterized protein (TIGR03086 family)
MHRDASGHDHLTLFESAVTVTQRLVDGLDPADLALPTPCAEYNVRRLLQHLIGWQLVFAACAVDEEPPFAGGSPTYALTDDPGRDLRAASVALVRNLRGRAADAVTLPYRGETSVGHLVDELVAETVIHTWDLATGLGRPVEYDEATVATAHTGLTKLLSESFADQAFRSPTAGTATNDFDRLLVRSGRSPSDWRYRR